MGAKAAAKVTCAARSRAVRDAIMPSLCLEPLKNLCETQPKVDGPFLKICLQNANYHQRNPRQREGRPRGLHGGMLGARALWDIASSVSDGGHTYTTLRHIQHGTAVELWHDSLGAFHVFAMEDTQIGRVGAVYCCFSSGVVIPLFPIDGASPGIAGENSREWPGRLGRRPACTGAPRLRQNMQHR
jgi:hypothetical protein